MCDERTSSRDIAYQFQDAFLHYQHIPKALQALKALEYAQRIPLGNVQRYPSCETHRRFPQGLYG